MLLKEETTYGKELIIPGKHPCEGLRAVKDSARPATPNPSTDPCAPAKRKKGRLLPFLGTIGDLRDALLVGAGTVYILGYMTWSISAYSQGLGLLPALEPQYFMAGIVPGAILGLVLLALFHVGAMTHFLQRLVGPEKSILKGTFRYVAYACLAATVLLFIGRVALVRGWLSGLAILPNVFAEHILAMPVAFAVLILILITVLFFGGGLFTILSLPFLFLPARFIHLRQKGYDDRRLSASAWLVATLPRFHVTYNAIVVATMGLFAYGTYFQYMPQEFGGIGKRCAYLDFDSDQVSRATLEALAEPSTPIVPAPSAPMNEAVAGTAQTAPAGTQPTREDRSGAVPGSQRTKIVRSRRVAVIFKASTVIVIEAAGLRRELTPAIVRAITWCDSLTHRPE